MCCGLQDTPPARTADAASDAPASECVKVDQQRTSISPTKSPKGQDAAPAAAASDDVQSSGADATTVRSEECSVQLVDSRGMVVCQGIHTCGCVSWADTTCVCSCTLSCTAQPPHQSWFKAISHTHCSPCFAALLLAGTLHRPSPPPNRVLTPVLATSVQVLPRCAAHTSSLPARLLEWTCWRLLPHPRRRHRWDFCTM